MAVAPFIALGLGALMIVLAIVSIFRTRRFLATAVTVEGTITDIEKRERTVRRQGETEQKTTFHPRISFTTKEGKPYEFIERTGTSMPTFAVGGTVQVKYDPANPQEARMATTYRLWATPVIMMIIGIAAIIIGVILLLTL
jgi:hypothetical protein